MDIKAPRVVAFGGDSDQTVLLDMLCGHIIFCSVLRLFDRYVLNSSETPNLRGATLCNFGLFIPTNIERLKSLSC